MQVASIQQAFRVVFINAVKEPLRITLKNIKKDIT